MPNHALQRTGTWRWGFLCILCRALRRRWPVAELEFVRRTSSNLTRPVFTSCIRYGFPCCLAALLLLPDLLARITSCRHPLQRSCQPGSGRVGLAPCKLYARRQPSPCIPPARWEVMMPTYFTKRELRGPGRVCSSVCQTPGVATEGGSCTFPDFQRSTSVLRSSRQTSAVRVRPHVPQMCEGPVPNHALQRTEAGGWRLSLHSTP